jgi:hypothetical protein
MNASPSRGYHWARRDRSRDLRRHVRWGGERECLAGQTTMVTYFQFTNFNSGKCLDVGGQANGSTMEQFNGFPWLVARHSGNWNVS